MAREGLSGENRRKMGALVSWIWVVVEFIRIAKGGQSLVEETHQRPLKALLKFMELWRKE